MNTRVLVVLALHLGCSTTESAVDECEALGVALCGFIESCAIPNRASTIEQCLTNFGYAIACDDAARVSESYDECMAELESRVCPENPFLLLGSSSDVPVSCIGAIELK